MSSLIDSEAGLVLSVWFALALVKTFYNCKANDLGVVWYIAIMNGQIGYRCLLTNRLHGKAAELCSANS